MKPCIAAMPSYTYVMKGEKLLRARGISCEIKRNEKIAENGCGYSLYISGSCEYAEKILKNYSIPVTITPYGGV
ncbi:MAG: DUF3343 domain-containing protein [Oscillospiraceae bacterium]|nr:DUF3343 domain-containing protein [Oscillospiraceae bacterium]